MLSVSEGCGSGDPRLRLGLTDGHWGIQKGKLPVLVYYHIVRGKRILGYIILLLSNAWLQLLIQQHRHERFFFHSAVHVMLVKGPGLTALGIEPCVSPQHRGKGSWLQAVLLIRFQ